MEHLNISQIGKKLYPNDNGYQYNLITKEQSWLAGTVYDDPKLVEIISEPYKLQVDSTWSKEKNIYEFVTVLYNGEPYICMNNFTDKFISAEEYKKSLSNYNEH